MKNMDTSPCFLYLHTEDEKIDGMICLQADDCAGAVKHSVNR